MEINVNSEPNVEIKKLKFRIREVAKQNNIKLYQIAEKIGKDPTYISKIEKGHVNTTIGVIQEIADAMNVPVHELIEKEKGYEHFYSEGVYQGLRKL